MTVDELDVLLLRNDPNGLSQVANKMYIVFSPKAHLRTLVTRGPREIRAR